MGDPIYAQWAVNCACSVRFCSPDLRIVVLHEPGYLDKINDYEKQVFDEFIEIKKEYCWDGEKLTPGVAKLHMYEYFNYEENLYIDVDSIIIKDLNELFDQNQDKTIAADTVGMFTETSPSWSCQWLSMQDVRHYYKLPDQYKLPEINSSYIYSKKNEEAEKFWYQARNNILEGYRGIWGKSFPDELAFNVAFAQLGIDPSGQIAISATSILNGKSHSISTLIPHYYILTYWGGKNMRFATHYGNYDRWAGKVHRDILKKHNPYKQVDLMRKKYVKTHKSGIKKPEVLAPMITDSLYKMSDTIKVELTAKENHGYYTMNGSLFEHEGKLLFCFRRDRNPFGKSSRLFITELDEGYRQIKPAIEIKGLPHNVNRGPEDGRLFYDGGLCLTYNDNQDQWTCELDENYQPKNIVKFERIPGLPIFGTALKNIASINKTDFVWTMGDDHILIKDGEKVTAKGFNVDYGELRGGTACIKIGKEYYSVFHTVRYLGASKKQYCAGVYKFNEKGDVIDFTKKPLLVAEWTNNRMRPYPDVFVIFPVGLYHKDGNLFMSFGHQDIETRVLKFNIKDLWQRNQQ